MDETERRFYEEFDRDYPDTDLYLYFGGIRRPFDDHVIEELRIRRKKKNIMVMMTTSGGDPNAAYRIARAIQRQYEVEPAQDSVAGPAQSNRRFFLFVDSFCVSAGTLVALGATDLILSDYAELGPLDVQIRRPDEPMERDSGLTPAQALTSMERRSMSLFKAHFEQLRNDRAISLTTRSAVESAASITSGLMGPIYGQIDPLRLGEVERLMEIAAEYGTRLGKFNLKDDTIARLLHGYPSHTFVIDRREARDLFQNVERPKDSAVELGERMRPFAESRSQNDYPVHFFFTPEADASFGNAEEHDNGREGAEDRRKGAARKSKRNANNGDKGTEGE